MPHHATQRGNRREPVFFGAVDYRLYRRLIATAARRADAEIWAYFLMPNHVHLIVPTADGDGLRATFAEAHRRRTCWRLRVESRSIRWSRSWRAVPRTGHRRAPVPISRATMTSWQRWHHCAR